MPAQEIWACRGGGEVEKPGDLPRVGSAYSSSNGPITAYYGPFPKNVIIRGGKRGAGMPEVIV